jgi:hypothetical protein
MNTYVLEQLQVVPNVGAIIIQDRLDIHSLMSIWSHATPKRPQQM